MPDSQKKWRFQDAVGPILASFWRRKSFPAVEKFLQSRKYHDRLFLMTCRTARRVL
jgi:hypothetical protein